MNKTYKSNTLFLVLQISIFEAIMIFIFSYKAPSLMSEEISIPFVIMNILILPIVYSTYNVIELTPKTVIIKKRFLAFTKKEKYYYKDLKSIQTRIHPIVPGILTYFDQILLIKGYFYRGGRDGIIYRGFMSPSYFDDLTKELRHRTEKKE